MTSADVRDMLDLPLDRQRPAKKQKIVEKRPDGITRELFSLIGERAPPVAITSQIKYKERPKWSHKVQPWEIKPFTNPARDDGLVLRHWKRKEEVKPKTQETTEENEESKVDGEADTTARSKEKVYPYAKFNVRVSVPQYTETQYERHLRNDGWSKEETGYLMSLCQEYDLRWILVADRYDYRPGGEPKAEEEDDDNSTVTPGSRRRTMEDLKARYYSVAAKMTTLNHPLENMLPEEYEQYEKLAKFSAVQETQRKNMAEALLSRTPEDVKEEEVLLAELRRISSNQDRLLEERKELYSRLDAPQSAGNTQMYQSSQGLGQLMQTLLAADKNKKRRSLAGPSGDGTSSPAEQTAPTQRDGKDTGAAVPAAAGGAGHRDSIGGSATKKGGAAGGQPPITERRKLSAREEEQFGVSHHDRLTSGVSFRGEKVSRILHAKSNVQMQRVNSLMTELDIPMKLVMPTGVVCAEFERLIRKLHDLLDVRKVSEKMDSELKVVEAMREERERKASGGDGAGEESGLTDDQAEDAKRPVDREQARDESNQADGDTGGDAADVEMADARDAEEDAEAEAEDEHLVKDEDEAQDDDADEQDVDGEPDADEEADAEADVSTAAPPIGASLSPSRAGSRSRPSSSRSRQKRSASVMSTRSDKSSKRQRK